MADGPRRIIADNLPTMHHCYENFTKVTPPSHDDLLLMADGIIDALRAAGFVIEEKKIGVL